MEANYFMSSSSDSIFKTVYTFLKDLLIRDFDYLSVEPTRALLFMTYRCTSNCKMCTIWKRSKKVDPNEELTLDDWKKVIDQLDDKNIEIIEIFGGDSLIRKDVTIPLIKYIKQKNEKIFIDLPTNCNLLDKNTAIDLVKSGLDRIYISLDGPIDIHDKIRGNKGTYNRVQKALKYLVEAKNNLKSKTPMIMINCTVSRSNLHNFEKILPAIEKISIDGIDFEYVGEFKEDNIQNSNVDNIIPTPFYIKVGNSSLINRDQAVLLKKKMNDIKKSTDNYKIIISTKHIDSLTIDDLVNGTIPNKKCFMCHSMVAIDPYGNFMGCFHYNNYILGNVKKLLFSSIWRNTKHQNFIKAQTNGDIKICKNCISGVNRNATLFQTIYRYAYFNVKGKGFDEP